MNEREVNDKVGNQNLPFFWHKKRTRITFIEGACEFKLLKQIKQNQLNQLDISLLYQNDFKLQVKNSFYFPKFASKKKCPVSVMHKSQFV